MYIYIYIIHIYIYIYIYILVITALRTSTSSSPGSRARPPTPLGIPLGGSLGAADAGPGLDVGPPASRGAYSTLYVYLAFDYY